MDAKGRMIVRRTILGLTVLCVMGSSPALVRHHPVFRAAPASHAGGLPKSPGAVGVTLPIAFEPNRGQTAAQVRFLGRASGYQFFIKDDESVIALNALTRRQRGNGASSGSIVEEPRVIRIKLTGANPSQKIDTSNPLPGRVNYLRGGDPASWRTGIPTYRSVTQHDVWPGIDLVYYGDSGTPDRATL